MVNLNLPGNGMSRPISPISRMCIRLTLSDRSKLVSQQLLLVLNRSNPSSLPVSYALPRTSEKRSYRHFRHDEGSIHFPSSLLHLAGLRLFA
ncbi:hypothetical protein PMAYCL1PPCAC_04764, partial [Pristionchus mayeri]